MPESDDDAVPGELVPFDAIEEMLFNPNAVIEDDPIKAAREVVQSILDAETVDDVLSETQVTHARDMLDVPFVALAFRLHRSDFGGDGPGVFAVIDGATKDGDKLTITCGARNVIAQLYRIAELNGFPRPVMLVERGRGKEGRNPPMRLVTPDNF